MWTGSLVPRASLLVGGAPHEREKSPGNEVGVACGQPVDYLWKNKMADDTLSSEDEAAFRFW